VKKSSAPSGGGGDDRRLVAETSGPPAHLKAPVVGRSRQSAAMISSQAFQPGREAARAGLKPGATYCLRTRHLKIQPPDAEDVAFA
jgi:hypothetical protein